jgi:hypothetical protein
MATNIAPQSELVRLIDEEPLARPAKLVAPMGIIEYIPGLELKGFFE